MSEACANAIDAQRAVDADAPVAIRIELDDGGVVVTVTDHAGGFVARRGRPAARRSTTPVGSATSAASGLPLMRSLAESVHLHAHRRRHRRADRGPRTAERARSDRVEVLVTRSTTACNLIATL